MQAVPPTFTQGSNNNKATTASPNTVSSLSPYLLPPTTASFPTQLSPASQHFVLRHADAIPTLKSLLSHPDVYEQSLWILGSIAAGDSGSNTSADTSTTWFTINKAVAAREVLILAAGIMNPLLQCMEVHKSQLSLQRIGSLCLSLNTSQGGNDGEFLLYCRNFQISHWPIKEIFP